MKKCLLTLSLLIAATSIPAVAQPSILALQDMKDEHNIKPMTKKTIAIKTAGVVGYTAEVVLPLVVYFGFIKGCAWAMQGKFSVNDIITQMHFAVLGKGKSEKKRNAAIGVILADGTVLALAAHGIYGLQKELLQPAVKKLVQGYKARRAAKTA